MKRSEEERALVRAKPACLSEDEWKGWKSFANARPRPSVNDGPCIDCLPAFKAHAEKHGKCSWSCVEFYRLDDGSIEGRRTSVLLRGKLRTFQGVKIVVK